MPISLNIIFPPISSNTYPKVTLKLQILKYHLTRTFLSSAKDDAGFLINPSQKKEEKIVCRDDHMLCLYDVTKELLLCAAAQRGNKIRYNGTNSSFEEWKYPLVTHPYFLGNYAKFMTHIQLEDNF